MTSTISEGLYCISYFNLEKRVHQETYQILLVNVTVLQNILYENG